MVKGGAKPRDWKSPLCQGQGCSRHGLKIGPRSAMKEGSEEISRCKLVRGRSVTEVA